MYAALLQYAKEHEITVKDFSHHKSNGGITQLTTINAIESFKHGKKGVEIAARMEQAVHIEVALIKLAVNVTQHTHTRNAQRLAKSAISVVKNHFSSCSRSNVGQGQGHQSDRTQPHGRSTERHH